VATSARVLSKAGELVYPAGAANSDGAYTVGATGVSQAAPFERENGWSLGSSPPQTPPLLRRRAPPEFGSSSVNDEDAPASNGG
jgi:hypothetical protein